MSGLAAEQDANGAARPGRPVLNRNQRLAIAAFTLAVVGVMTIVWVLAGGNEKPSEPRLRGIPAAEFKNPRLGLTVLYPHGWTSRAQRGVVRLTSPERSVTVAISSPTTGSFAPRVRREAVRALIGGYTPASIIRHAPGRLGRTPVVTTEIAGTDRAGNAVRILSTATATRWRTYAVQVLSSTRPSASRLLEAAAILRSITLTRPVAK